MKDIRRHNNYCLIATIAIFLILYLVSKIYLRNLYLFEWTQRHCYLGIWIIAIGLILLNKTLISAFISVGNVVGIFLGQYMGDWIRKITMSQITAGMEPETVYQLQHHPGVEIWLLTIAFFCLELLQRWRGKEKWKTRLAYWSVSREEIERRYIL